MELVTWILIGGATGAVSAWVGRGGRGSGLWDLAFGLAGAVVFGLAASTVGSGLPTYSWPVGAFTALMGAVLAVAARRRFRRRSHRRGSFVGPYYAP